MSKDFNDCTPIFVVRDLEASVAYYRDALGFTVDFTYGEPPTYAGVYRGSVLFHLQAESVADRAPGGSAVYVYVEDADRTYAEFRKLGARVGKEPQDYPYGLRDFDVRDLDGNRLVVASETKTETGA
jgi:catechol 2,3-dioxygenase-like lactoylglutathione lyase family enzyme